MKIQTDKIANNVTQILSRLDELETSNKRLQERNQELELEMEKMRSEWRDGVAAVADEVYQRTRRRKNIIILGVPESNFGSLKERKEADENFCQELFTDALVLRMGIESV